MMKKIALFCFLAFLVGGVQTAAAQATAWEFDRAHSNFYFSVEHIYSKIRGYFGEYGGEVFFDPENLAESRFVFEIPVDSINTHIAKRDEHLRSEDFFNAAEFPTMRFESTAITETAPGNYAVAGTFTVKGKPHDLVLPLTFAGMKEHPMMKDTVVAGFNGAVTIDRLAYGVGTGKFYDLGVLGREVDIVVSLELIRKK